MPLRPLLVHTRLSFLVPRQDFLGLTGEGLTEPLLAQIRPTLRFPPKFNETYFLRAAESNGLAEPVLLLVYFIMISHSPPEISHPFSSSSAQFKGLLSHSSSKSDSCSPTASGGASAGKRPPRSFSSKDRDRDAKASPGVPAGAESASGEEDGAAGAGGFIRPALSQTETETAGGGGQEGGAVLVRHEVVGLCLFAGRPLVCALCMVIRWGHS